MGRIPNLLLAAGYLAVAAAVVVARRSPATGYEPSIYTATPTGTWIALGIGLSIALAVSVVCRDVHQAAGIVLGGFAVTTVVSLPIVRGYYFHGKGDALTHLGWVRDFVGGTMAPHELFYPGLHSVASMFVLVAGVEPQHALMAAVVVFFVPFVVFVPLVVRLITDNPVAVGFGAIIAWLVLPVNNIATHMGAHSNSNALFFVPVFAFAVLAYLTRRSSDERLPFGLSPYGALIVLSGLGLLLIHPQQMVNAVILLGAISAVQLVARRRYDEHPVLEHPTIHVYSVVMAVTFAAWAFANERFRNALGGLIYGLLTADIGTGEEVGQRGASLTEIGGSLPELFAKLFLVSAVLALVVGSYILVVWAGRSRASPGSRALVSYLAVALIPLGGLFVVYFMGTPTMAFRQIGFIFVVVTILAGVALGAFVGWFDRFAPTVAVSGIIAVALAVCLVVAMLTVFGSPFIYNPTQHVSEQTYHGYETAITGGTDHPYAGYGYTTYRYNDAIYGVETMTDEQAAIMWPGEGVIEMDAFNDGDYGDAYPGDGPYFLIGSEFDTVREHEIYHELNYQSVSLESLEDEVGSARYVSNPEVFVYEIRDH
ncbi:DUF6541 family protein [Halovivax gelatinilyticus]|uniref:DUF6541 family protein n=1 Tax=Halovivax gelatinilyticus TaxID=2961597 RepID=UPI0020CA6708|nr:DUF6541 family protein [Halovivax gelatinilyticus]